ncbi:MULTISPECIES: helix-turn-helix transcriptional regulator [unclassified Streptomyces]|uniref:helix-turn-helix domain-containing protein n=1 Tax=unclassified Streptomyces TaxID=2593676 RepID=UPI00278BD858|nr:MULTISPECIES: helix-turn-helix transcriptional regulator [unclassified Streptomyces]
MAGTEAETERDQGAEEEARQDWDEGVSEVLELVGRQVRRWRERAGMTQAELGTAIGYTEHQVSAVERGRRIPKAVLLERADQVLGAQGMLAEFKEDMERARYPRKVRDLAKVEATAAELSAYACHQIHGLLQTPDYIRALYEMRQPALEEDLIEQYVAARLARQKILERHPAPNFNFVQEQVTLQRPLGGRMVLRGQLERLLEIGQLRNVQIQVMPTSREDHAGLGGSFLLIDPLGGPKAGHIEAQHLSRLITERNELRRLETQYGIIRAQALTPRESLAFIEKVLGET